MNLVGAIFLLPLIFVSTQTYAVKNTPIHCGVLKGKYAKVDQQSSFFSILSCDFNSTIVSIKVGPRLVINAITVFNGSYLQSFSFAAKKLFGVASVMSFSVINNATLRQQGPKSVDWVFAKLDRRVLEIHVVGLHFDMPAEVSRVEAMVTTNFPPQIRDFPYYLWSRIVIGGCATYNYKGLTTRTHSPGKLVAIAYAHIQVWEDFVIRNKVNNVVPPERYNDTIILLESDAMCNMENCGGLSLDLLRYSRF